MSKFRLKPAPVDAAHAREGLTCRIVSFPPARGRRRILAEEGEEVEAKTGTERRWWLSLIRSGDVVEIKGKKPKGKPRHAEAKAPRDSENLKENAPVG